MIYKSYLIEKNLNTINEKLILFYGENLGLKDEFKKKLKKNKQDAEIIYLFQEDVINDQEKFFNTVLNLSLFEKRKIFFIDNANDKLLTIIQDIETKLDEQKIYFFSDILEKKSKLRNYFDKSNHTASIACYPDNELTIKNIILKKLKGFTGLSAENINMIIGSTNLDRNKLYNELEKILTYFQNKNIEYEKLASLMNIRVNDNFNLLKDEALKGNKIKTNKYLSETLIDEEKNILYLNFINQRLNKLKDINLLTQSTNLDNALNTVKPTIFWKDKPIIIEQIKKWNSKKIKDVLKQTYNLEIEFKSNSNISKNILMKKLLIDICELANS